MLDSAQHTKLQSCQKWLWIPLSHPNILWSCQKWFMTFSSQQNTTKSKTPELEGFLPGPHCMDSFHFAFSLWPPPPIRVGAILLWSHKNLTRARVATRKGMHGINGILRFVNHSLVMWINSNTSGPYEFQYSYGGWPRKKKYIYFLKKKKKIQKKHILIDFRQKIASLDWLWATPPPKLLLDVKAKM